METRTLDAQQARHSLPTRGAALLFAAKAELLRVRRSATEALGRGPRRFQRGAGRPGDATLGESVCTLGLDGPEAERALTLGKIHNLRLAARRLDGVLVPSGGVFSFWAHVGRATRRAGYVEGRELREGCIVPAVGGGLCQLSNALYDAALNAGFEIVERHAHTSVIAGSLAERGRDATVFWNYVDLRFRPQRDIRIAVELGRDELRVRFAGVPARAPAIDLVPLLAVPAMTATAHDHGDCGSCNEESCFRHAPELSRPAGRTAYLLDGVWPEYDIEIASSALRSDIACVPVDGVRLRRERYAWTLDGFDTVQECRTLALARGASLRRAGAQGAIRQRANLDWSARLARAYAAQLPYDAEHVVVAQHLLPELWRSGALGGRTFDVLMTGMPLGALQRALDRAAAAHPESKTLADFRVDANAVACEADALTAARRIVTPHVAVATLFGARATLLPWWMPARTSLQRRTADALVFPASTLGRKGAYEVREAARRLGMRVVHPGTELEGPAFWNGVRSDRWPSYAAALAEAAVVVLPAYVEDQPRMLLRALASGVPVVASEACGLGDRAGLTTVAAGDADALITAINAARGYSAREASIGLDEAHCAS